MKITGLLSTAVAAAAFFAKSAVSADVPSIVIKVRHAFPSLASPVLGLS
jgi:hypothetical protein